MWSAVIPTQVGIPTSMGYFQKISFFIPFHTKERYWVTDKKKAQRCGCLCAFHF